LELTGLHKRMIECAFKNEIKMIKTVDDGLKLYDEKGKLGFLEHQQFPILHELKSSLGSIFNLQLYSTLKCNVIETLQEQVLTILDQSDSLYEFNVLKAMIAELQKSIFAPEHVKNGVDIKYTEKLKFFIKTQRKLAGEGDLPAGSVELLRI
jgi:hypothetical protein